MRKAGIAAVILALSIGLSGCGGDLHSEINDSYKEIAYTEDSDSEYYSNSTAAYDGEEKSSGYDSGSGSAAEGGDGSILRKQESQKIVYSGEMEIQTLEYDKSVAEIRQKVREAGGFSEYEKEYDSNYNWYNNDTGSGKTRSLTLTVRIPSDKFESFMSAAGEAGRVMDRSVRAENISQRYSDTQTYKSALEKEQERLLSMMDRAETIEDMIAVESRLSDVERELNRYKTDLAAMDKDVEYSTVSITISEVKRYTETKEETTFVERLQNAFGDAIDGFVTFCQELILVIVRFFPFLIIIAGITVLVISRERKRKRMRNSAGNTNGARRPLTPGSAGQAQAGTSQKTEKEAQKK